MILATVEVSDQCLLLINRLPIALQEGLKPIQIAAASGNRSAVEILFPLTLRVETISNWTVDGILEYMQSETSRQQVSRSGHFITKSLKLYFFSSLAQE